MKKTNKNQIIRQMFDVRPVKNSGDLDWEKIKQVEMAEAVNAKKNLRSEKVTPLKKLKICQLGKTFKSEDWPFYHDFYNTYAKKIESEKDNRSPIKKEKRYKKRDKKEYQQNLQKENIHDVKNTDDPINLFGFRDLFCPARLAFNFNFRKTAFFFGGTSLALFLFISGIFFWFKGIEVKGNVLKTGESAYGNLSLAVEDIKNQNFSGSSDKLSQAYENFSQASEDLSQLGDILIEVSRFFPYASQLSSGKNALEAGEHISLAGKYISDSINNIYLLKNPDTNLNSSKLSLLEISNNIKENAKLAGEELKEAQENIIKIKIDDLPKDKSAKFIELKSKLPFMLLAIENFSENSYVLTDLLGGNGPRKYLFLFQNNQEMRATGGFIGTYGLLDISNGHIGKFFIDGIFNPDGQLNEKIIPPKPIQKMSAAWSLHDSNWFPDFPLSAEKAIFFYEKTGGPTTDGVITFTPTVMQKLLEITGPIIMEEYDVVLDAENFIAKTQYEVEIDYDKEENRPKKILADLAPIVLDKLLSTNDLAVTSKTLDILSQALDEKHILLYSRNSDLQKIISDLGWSGEILQTPKDYLSVVNTNINGYKTDGVVEESMEHQAEIKADGSIIDTVTITRKHSGGNSQYEWWNKVNANYMRVYVPLGSQLLEVEGQTREFNNPPLDYAALEFKRDADVEKEESNIFIDEEAGTRIYQDADKTVFANWVYVSPQETVTIKYKYRLPFKLKFDKNNPADAYSLLIQKQSGSLGSRFNSEIKYPENYKLEWSCPGELEKGNRELKFDSDLETDKFIGAVFLSE